MLTEKPVAAAIGWRDWGDEMVDMHFWSAKRLAGAVRRRKIGCLELLDHYLKRVETHNPALNAIIATDLFRAPESA